ncbi:MAG: histidine phosphatase family protein [Methylibium sp.]|nr:histidine phosphatase family protein [Methylibium sp.]
MDQVTSVLAVRHGETAWNRETRIQGQLDIPLSPLGAAQARRLAQALDGQGVEVIYASDLSRARQTAEAVAQQLGLAVQLEPGLRERGFGLFEGLTWAEIETRWPAESERWRRRDPQFAAQGGESLQDFYARSVAAVESLASRHPGQTVLIVAHGGVLDCLYRAAARQSLQAARTWTLGNASINRLLYSQSGLTLVGWNDDNHLAGLSLDDKAA